MLRALLLALSRSRWLKSFAYRHPLARRVARRFVAGETLEEALGVARDLQAQGFGAILDPLGENVSTEEEARRAGEEARGIVAAIRAANLDAYLSVKLTHLGLDVSQELCQEILESILAEAEAREVFVRIDMEGSAYTERTLQIAEQAFARHKNVGVVLQSYLRRSRRDLARCNQLGMRVRLCKGAYAEPPSVAYQKRSEVDANFLRLMEDLLLHGTSPAIATHDERLLRAALDFARKHGIPPSAYEIQMLYGVRRERQAELVRQGCRVRIYVPYGPEWFPYFMRRLAERPANLLFFLTALVKG
jgi:proline dehydrogenase